MRLREASSSPVRVRSVSPVAPAGQRWLPVPVEVLASRSGSPIPVRRWEASRPPVQGPWPAALQGPAHPQAPQVLHGVQREPVVPRLSHVHTTAVAVAAVGASPGSPATRSLAAPLQARKAVSAPGVAPHPLRPPTNLGAVARAPPRVKQESGQALPRDTSVRLNKCHRCGSFSPSRESCEQEHSRLARALDAVLNSASALGRDAEASPEGIRRCEEGVAYLREFLQQLTQEGPEQVDTCPRAADVESAVQYACGKAEARVGHEQLQEQPQAALAQLAAEDGPRTPPVPCPRPVEGPAVLPKASTPPAHVSNCSGSLRWRSPGRRWSAESLGLVPGPLPPGMGNVRDSDADNSVSNMKSAADGEPRVPTACSGPQPGEPCRARNAEAASSPPRSLSPGSEWRRVRSNLKVCQDASSWRGCQQPQLVTLQQGTEARSGTSHPLVEAAVPLTVAGCQTRQSVHGGQDARQQGGRILLPRPPVAATTHASCANLWLRPGRPLPSASQSQGSCSPCTPPSPPVPSSVVSSAAGAPRGLEDLLVAAERIIGLDPAATREQAMAAAAIQPSEAPGDRFSRVRSALARVVSGEAAAHLRTAMQSTPAAAEAMASPGSHAVEKAASPAAEQAAVPASVVLDAADDSFPHSIAGASSGIEFQLATRSESCAFAGHVQQGEALAGCPDAGAGTGEGDSRGQAEAVALPVMASSVGVDSALRHKGPMLPQGAASLAAEASGQSVRLTDVQVVVATATDAVAAAASKWTDAQRRDASPAQSDSAGVMRVEPLHPSAGGLVSTEQLPDSAVASGDLRARRESTSKNGRNTSPQPRLLTLGKRAPSPLRVGAAQARAAGASRSPGRAAACATAPGVSQGRSPSRSRPAATPADAAALPAAAAGRRGQPGEASVGQRSRLLSREAVGSGHPGAEPAFTAQQLRSFLRSSSPARSQSSGRRTPKSLRQRGWC
mmetsp:Transcript_60580/g.195126  ORF Transcript_60580/g.195126 Transcript_60580/m.195126 type:complete len:956 (-) Transcript_60580:232-3099(-)